MTLRTASTLQCSQTLDPFTVMHTYTDLCLAHPLETWTPFDIAVNSAYALLTMPVIYKPTNVVNSPFIRYSGTSAYNILQWSIPRPRTTYIEGKKIINIEA